MKSGLFFSIFRLQTNHLDVPFLGRMAVVPVSGKGPKSLFHGAEELNDALVAS